MKKIKKESSSTMNWKLIVVGCSILILIFTIILVSVLSSVQQNYVQLQKIQSGISGDTLNKNSNSNSNSKKEGGAEEHRQSPPPGDLSSILPAINNNPNLNRDYTIPYKLPPTPQDEELWFDELMKLNRLKPPPLNSITNNNNSLGSPHPAPAPAFSPNNNNNNNFNSNPNNNNNSNNNKHYNQRIHIDSGNFRVQLATIWDPHPSYRFRAFGKDWRIDLVPSTNFVVPGFRVTEHHEGGNQSSRFGNEFNGCFYNGVVNGDEKSSVAVSLCHGMTGHIRTSEGSYFIEPTGEWKGPHIPIQHVIYKLPSIPNAHQDDVLQPPIQKHPQLSPSSLRFDTSSSSSSSSSPSSTASSGGKSRVKRSMSKERHVELMVAADTTMTNYHGPNLRHYILTLLSIVALVYRDASIGNPINIALVNLHILKDKDFARKSTNSSTGLSASDMLRNFCKWQKDMNEFDDNSILHHDTALLLTRETICRNPWLGKCDTLGLAELGTMCDHYASCALVQDNGLSAAFTIAHELGHVMNMPHDDDYKCQSFISQTSKPASSTNNNNTPGTKSNEHYVMSRMLDHNTYPWAWSKCSRHYLTEFLDAGHGSCLEDKPLVENLIMENSINDNQSKQPGEIFNEHKQCQLVFGHDSKLCSYMPVCRRLWCTTGDSDSEGCRTQHMPWADGTPCGDTKWCLKGACVLKDLETLRIVDGGWGGWGDYGECSRSCGGGVRRSLRECDNPSPSNGGKYCTGPRVRYESCNTYECEKEMKDYRLEQCAKYNDDNFNIQGLPKDVQWVPKYTGISPKDRCKLFCRVMGSSAYYLLKEKVVDGTPCGPDTFDICVNGACLPAGCDRRLHSRKVLDICGVCGGDGSTCHTQSGSYNETSYGYSTVVRIPSGASSIDIRQISATSRDDNYLALLDPTSNEYLLNGHFVVSMFRKNVHGPGTILEYSGSDSNTERINSSRPIQSDLVVQVLSVGKLTKPNIQYQFVISTNNRSGSHGHGHGHGHHGNSNNSAHPGKFSWKINSFNCSSPCYGNAIPKYDCYRDNNIVNSHYCTHLHYPMLKVKYCNTHCKHSWKLYSKSDCILTTECGKGFKNVNYKCSLHYNNGSSILVGDEKCSGGDPKPDGKEPCVVQCDAPKWKYGAWGECDTICGDGWQVRSGICHFQNQVVDPHYCGNVSNTTQGGDNGDDRGLIVVTSGKKLTVKRKCNDRDCGNWKIDQWSPCSRTCGDGYSRAAYACYLGSSILPPDYCLNSPRPVVERKCDLPPCHQWQLGNYNCEQCGTNTTRELKCTTFTAGQVTDDYNCDGLEKPDNLVYCGNCPLPKSAPLVSDESVSDRDRSRERERDRDRIFNENSDKNSNKEMPNQAQIPFEDLQNQDVVLGEWMTSEFSDCTETSSSSSESVYVRIRQVTCSTNDCNPDTKPVKTTDCGMWSTGKWSECNSTCGLGHEIRAVTCTFDSKASLNGNCPPPIPSMTRECLKSNKCQWKLGPWSKCSKNCGNGVRIRQVVCEGEVCVEEKPNAVENCNNEPCPLWVVGEWTECSSTCGGGIRERSVRCLDWDYKIASESKCADLVKPNTTETCSEWDCGEINSIDDSFAYRWNVGTWSNCTKKCGKGFKLRDVNCTKLNYSSGRLLSKAIVTDENCRGQKPRAKRGCARFPCAFKWITSPWSECSRECGYGIQERSVSCHRVNKYGWIDPDPLHSCNDEDKPKNYNYCFLGDCQETYRWKTDPWTPCTSKCGKITRQKRRVYCISTKSNGRVNANNCKEILKPNRKRKCPVVQCGLISCNGLQNGNQIILVGGKNITIYCHNGREYINLNNEENFSEVYEKRLIRPETCPRDGVRLETCECIVDRNRKSGFTFYDKIGINVTNLRVQADDYEFTRQVNGSPINYGEAGDCYSSVNCPQGRFSINLNGTGFSVSPETVWTSQGHRASMWIHKSKDSNVVTGRCGGYCGTCSPHRLTGIKVQV